MFPFTPRNASVSLEPQPPTSRYDTQAPLGAFTFCVAPLFESLLWTPFFFFFDHLCFVPLEEGYVSS
ncbi:hypothetical protein TgHK011_002117 [Trichoderma gracile]|nr:hypothetical protein TgHK011_002117 [Trichoderma gracile]